MTTISNSQQWSILCGHAPIFKKKSNEKSLSQASPFRPNQGGIKEHGIISLSYILLRANAGKTQGNEDYF